MHFRLRKRVFREQQQEKPTSASQGIERERVNSDRLLTIVLMHVRYLSLSLRLISQRRNQGDVLVMDGEDIQKLYEVGVSSNFPLTITHILDRQHTVEPRDFRIAATARFISQEETQQIA